LLHGVVIFAFMRQRCRLMFRRRFIAVILPLVVGCTPKQTEPTPTVTALTVSCDETTFAAVGQQGHCRANVRLSDSTTQDQTSAAQWSSSDPTKVAVSATGQITAVGLGRAEVSATFSGLIGRQSVTVSVSCEFSVSPTSLSFPSSGGSDRLVVTAAPSGCSPAQWTATANNAGLTATPSAGTGGAVVTLTAAVNTGSSQMWTAVIAGQTVTVSVAGPPRPQKTKHALHLTLREGEQLSGPYAGFVTGPNGFKCTQGVDPTVCPPGFFDEDTRVQLVVTLTVGANDGRPIKSAKGCDALSATTCTLVMNGPRDVTIAIGCEVACGGESAQIQAWSTIEPFRNVWFAPLHGSVAKEETRAGWDPPLCILGSRRPIDR